MPEENEDVTPASSTGEEEVVKEPVETTPQEETQPQTEETSKPEEVKEEELVKDDRPIQNVAWEAKRKIDELYTTLPQIVKSAIEEQMGSRPVSRQEEISDDQLLWAIEDPSADPQAKFWARKELKKREEERQDKKLKEVFTSYKTENESNLKRQQAFQWVNQNFPDVFIKDAQGNFLGINRNNPLATRIDEYMRDPDAPKRPDAIVIAAKNAAFDLGVTSNKQLRSKVDQTTAQLRREQKKTLIAGGGVKPTETDTKSKIIKLAQKYQDTRDPEIFKELSKLRGLLPSAKT